jgi:hypothetical protein
VISEIAGLQDCRIAERDGVKGKGIKEEPRKPNGKEAITLER